MSPRRMEEASVAGESPDKSEQQQSSGAARSERDPRLAVFREPASPAESGGRADTATAVFGTQRFEAEADGEADAAVGGEAVADSEAAVDADAVADGETAAEAEAEAAAAAAAEAEAESESVVGADSDSVAGIGTGADSDAEVDVPSGPEADEDPVAAQEPESAAAAEGAPEGPESSVEAPGAESGAAESAGEPEEPAEGVGLAGAADAAEASDADPAEQPEDAAAEPGNVAAEPEEGAADPEQGAAEPEQGDARLRAAVAAWVSKADAQGDGDRSDDGPADDDQAGDGRSEAEPEPVADTDEQAERSDATSESETPEPIAELAGESAAEPIGGAAAESSDSDETSGGSGSRSDSDETSGDSDGGEASSTDSASKSTASASTAPASAGDVSDDASGDASDQARVPRTRAESGAEPSSKSNAESAEDTPATPATPATDSTPDAGEKAGIDQPTAVFKAPLRPRIDQPTTALKVTPPPAKQTPESPAERTSKFVPLRADDVRPAPAPRRPEADPAPVSEPEGSAQLPPDASLSGAERTRQQPMPPRPPLDLLAELTNTPPPRETPVRTAVRRVKIWTPLVVLLLIAFAIVQMVRPLPDPTLTLSANPTYTFEGSKPSLPWPDQGQGYMAATGLGKVGSFGEQKPVPIASVAKAMTAYLVLKDHPLKRGKKGPGITIDAKAESEGQLFSEGESTLDTVKKGDVLTESDALAALMIPSANNIARLLARWDAGSEKAFVKKMNATADELGMKNTTYTDPSGLTASTVSTAEDLVKLGEKLVEFPALMDITKLPEWKDPSGKTWRNYNTLVPYDNALGIKTGSTTKAGGNLLFAAHKMVDGTDQLIVGAVLGQHDTPIIDAVNAASKKVMLATLDLLEGAKVVKKGDVVGTVDDGMGGTTPVVATKDVRAVGWSGLTVKLELTDAGKTIPHSASAGAHVGTLTVGEGASQVKVPVALQGDLTEPTAGEKLTRIG